MVLSIFGDAMVYALNSLALLKIDRKEYLRFEERAAEKGKRRELSQKPEKIVYNKKHQSREKIENKSSSKL